MTSLWSIRRTSTAIVGPRCWAVDTKRLTAQGRHLPSTNPTFSWPQSLPHSRMLWNGLANPVSKLWHHRDKAESHSALTVAPDMLDFRRCHIQFSTHWELLYLWHITHPQGKQSLVETFPEKEASEDELHIKSIHLGNSPCIWYNVLKWQNSTCIHVHACACISAFHFVQSNDDTAQKFHVFSIHRECLERCPSEYQEWWLTASGCGEIVFFIFYNFFDLLKLATIVMHY